MATSKRKNVDHPTRIALLDAGLRIAARDGLSQMTIDAIVDEAEVAKGTYYVHFKNRNAYLVALYERWHRLLMEEIFAAIRGKEPGMTRLRAAGSAYLDACLKAQSIQALLVAGRSEIATAEVAARGSQEAATLIAEDFAVLGYTHPMVAAQLFVSTTIAAALNELDRGGADPTIRETLFQLAWGPTINQP